MNKTSRIRSLTLCALAALLLLAALTACGDDADSDPPTAQPVAPTAAAAADTAPSAAPAEPTMAPPAPRETGDVEGVTFIVGEGSEATFTVGEVLASVPLPIEAVMRTEELSGVVRLDGGESRIEIALQTLTSDQDRRDGWSRNRLFGRHPTGVFILPDATPLPEGFAEGEAVMTQITGMVELLGQTIPMTFDIEARDDGDVVVILGKTSFTWDDIGQPKPTSPSVVSIEDVVYVNVLISARPG